MYYKKFEWLWKFNGKLKGYTNLKVMWCHEFFLFYSIFFSIVGENSCMNKTIVIKTNYDKYILLLQ